MEWKIIDGQPHKVYHPENWIKLADLSPKELAKGQGIHGLTAGDVEPHTDFKYATPPGGAVHERSAEEKVGAKDKA